MSLGNRKPQASRNITKPKVHGDYSNYNKPHTSPTCKGVPVSNRRFSTLNFRRVVLSLLSSFLIRCASSIIKYLSFTQYSLILTSTQFYLMLLSQLQPFHKLLPEHPSHDLSSSIVQATQHVPPWYHEIGRFGTRDKTG